MDTADADTLINNLNPHVAFLLPVGGPCVLDKPVVEARALVVSPTDGEDVVVQNGGAIAGVEYTGHITHEIHRCSIDGDYKRLVNKCGFHLFDVVRS